MYITYMDILKYVYMYSVCFYIQVSDLNGEDRSYDFSEESSQVEPIWEPINQNTFLQLLYNPPRVVSGFNMIENMLVFNSSPYVLLIICWSAPLVSMPSASHFPWQIKGQECFKWPVFKCCAQVFLPNPLRLCYCCVLQRWVSPAKNMNTRGQQLFSSTEAISMSAVCVGRWGVFWAE